MPHAISTTAALAILLALPRSGIAQDGRPPSDLAKTMDGPWHEVNGEAWDAAVSGDSQRMLGRWSDQRFEVGISYESEDSRWGKKIGQEAITPGVTWDSPLFGGEAYTDFAVVLPLESREADRYYIYGGWKYALTSLFAADIGGNFVFTDKPVYGPGIAHPRYGYKQSGNVYLGLILTTLLNPSLYFIYEPELEQYQTQLGVFHSLELSRWIPISGLSLDAALQAGYIDASRWNGGRSTIQGKSWSNSYAYLSGTLDLAWKPCPNFRIAVGGRFAANNDGEGRAGPNREFNLGPESLAWFGSRASISF